MPFWDKCPLNKVAGPCTDPMPRLFTFLHADGSRRSAGFHISIWPSVQPAPHPPPPPTSLHDLRAQVHGASGSCLEQIPTCDKAWTNGLEGIQQTSSLQHRKQGLVPSYPPPPARDGYWDVSQGIKGRGKERQVEETLVTLISAASWTTQPFHLSWFSVHGQRRGLAHRSAHPITSHSNSTFAAAALLAHRAGA